MMQAVEKRFGSNSKPPKTIKWLTDNGSFFTAAETRSFARDLGLKLVTTPVKSPQCNGMAESFVKTLERYYAKLANLTCPLPARFKNCDRSVERLVLLLQFVSPAHRTWLLATYVVKGEKIGNLKIQAVMKYSVKTRIFRYKVGHYFCL